MSNKYFGGVLGGGSHTEVVIINENGDQIAAVEGGGSNPWQVTVEVCVKVISDLVIAAKEKAGLDTGVALVALGMSLSGGEQPEIQKRIKDGLSAMTPVISHCYYVCTDTFGPIAAAFQSGGMVLISGTGSNCELVNPNGQAHRCGGWGHMLGDEGSAYWIAHRAIRTVYNNDDGLVKSVHDTTLLKNTVYTFFKLKGQYDILDHLYEKFCKEKIALLCKELATVAVTKDDPIIKQIFFDAGEQLGKHVMALVPRVDQSLIEESGCVPVLIEGSVFSSWNLLRPGFVSAVSTCNHTINLYSLTDGYGGTFGAAILGAKSAGLKLNVDYNKSRTLFDSINTL